MVSNTSTIANISIAQGQGGGMRNSSSTYMDVSDFKSCGLLGKLEAAGLIKYFKAFFIKITLTIRVETINSTFCV